MTARGLHVVLSLLGATALLCLSCHVEGHDLESLDGFVREQMAARRIPGMAIAVIERDKESSIRTYGKASVEFDLPVERSTRFSVASITKSFTAVAIMQLVERRQLDLNDPIGRHLRDLPRLWREVTIRQLLNHTSGLPDLNVDTYTTNTIAQTSKDAFEILGKRAVDFTPGAAHRYNQTNYMLLGMLVAAKRGASFEGAVLEHQFATFKSQGPTFGDARTIVPGRATTYTPYRFTGERPIQLDHLEVLNAQMPAISHPGGGLNISIEDFAAWLTALINGELVGRESLELLWTPARLNDGSIFERPASPSLWQRYGLGWVLGEHDGHAFAGGTGGIRSAFFVYPKDNLAVIVLTNSQGARPESLVQGIGTRYLE